MEWHCKVPKYFELYLKKVACFKHLIVILKQNKIT